MVAPTASPPPQPTAHPPQSPPPAILTHQPPSPHPTSDIAHPTSPRTPLHPHQAALLANLIHKNLDLYATSEHLGIDLASLIDFVDRPEVKERIDTYQRFKLASINDRILTHTADARIAAIKDLHELNKTSDNPVEKRRAADLILRYSTPITFAAYAPRRSSSSSSSSLSNLKSQISNSSSSSPPSPPHPRIPPPPPCPTSNHLLQHLRSILLDHDITKPASEAKTLSAIHACFAPSSRINGHPVPTDPSHFPQSLDQAARHCFLSNVVQFMVGSVSQDDASRVVDIVCYHRAPEGVRELRFRLSLAITHPTATWQITSLDTPPHDSS